MNKHPNQSIASLNGQQPVEAQARHYARQLFSGSWTEEQMKAMSAWKEVDVGNAQALDQAVEAWMSLEPLADDAEVQAWCAGNRNKHPRRSPWYQVLQAATIGALAIGLTLLALWYTPSGDSTLTRYTTVVGEQKTVHLEDGSVLTLNTDSHLLTDITPEYRRVILDRGEAFFDIAHNPQRPFTVEVGSQSIRVLGTQFNVRKIRSELEVAIVDGVVLLHPSDEVAVDTAPTLKPSDKSLPLNADPLTARQFRLQAGSVLTIDTTLTRKVSLVQDDDIEQRVSWRTGKIRFFQQPLYKVVQELNRYSTRKILVEDPRIISLKVTGVLHADKLDEALAGLERSYPVRIKHYANNTVIIPRTE